MILYTAVIGRTDPLQPITTGLPAYCFTDSPTLEVRGWTMLRIPATDDPIRTARRIKILAHEAVPNARVSIWVDASFVWRQLPELMPVDAPVQALRHPDRADIQSEATEIIKLRLAKPDLVRAQVATYTTQGFVSPGLTGTGLLIRRHTPEVETFNRVWWETFSQAGHTRDQMSVDYAAWVSGVPITYLTGHYRQNPYVTFIKSRVPHPPDAHL